MHKKLLSFFLSFYFIAMGWLVLVPIWHTPDEQAHFGQVAYLAVTGSNTKGNVSADRADLTKEIFTAEEQLGTKRDQFGNNKFTFHPDFRIEYTNTLTGKYEASISALTLSVDRNTFIHQEASRYPPLYYIPAALLYRILNGFDLFVRLFVVRIWSLLLYFATLGTVYLLGRLIFESSLYTTVLTILVGLHPMFVFVSIGVTSDALGNLLFTLWLYYCAKLIRFSRSRTTLFKLGIITAFCIFNKPQFVILLPSFLLLVMFINIRNIKEKNILKVIGSVIISICLFLILYITIVPTSGLSDLLSEFIKELDIKSLSQYTFTYTIPHTIREVMPWYWGIYNWLGVTYPRIVHRIINRIVFVSIFGFMLWFWREIRNKRRVNRKLYIVSFYLLVNVFFFIGLSFYDWLSWHKSTYQLGIQGRYFFPLIATHMLFILLGVQQIFSFHQKVQVVGIKILAIVMVLFNFYGWYTVARAYYDVTSLTNFIFQASQYKPWFAKGNLLFVWFLLYVFSLFMLVLFLWKLRIQKSK